MDEKSEILDKIGHKDGMTVPEGYFGDFAARMCESLPVRDFEVEDQKPAKRTFWHQVRPYVYMAAMFAGIWCMMKMLSMMRTTDTDLSIDNYPGLISALSDDNFMNDYVYPDVDQYEMLDDLYDSGMTVDEIFGEDVDETVDPEIPEIPNDNVIE